MAFQKRAVLDEADRQRTLEELFGFADADFVAKEVVAQQGLQEEAHFFLQGLCGQGLEGTGHGSILGRGGARTIGDGDGQFPFPGAGVTPDDHFIGDRRLDASEARPAAAAFEVFTFDLHGRWMRHRHASWVMGASAA